MSDSSNAILAPPLSKAFNLLLDAVRIVDAHGNFVFVSAACESIFWLSAG